MRNFSRKLAMVMMVAVFSISSLGAKESAQCILGEFDDPCDQTAELMCAEGEINDGTGKSVKKEVGKAYVEKVKRELAADGFNYWVQALGMDKPAHKLNYQRAKEQLEKDYQIQLSDQRVPIPRLQKISHDQMRKYCSKAKPSKDSPYQQKEKVLKYSLDDEILRCAVNFGVQNLFHEMEEVEFGDPDWVFKKYYDHVYDAFKVPGLEAKAKNAFDQAYDAMFEVVRGFGLTKPLETEMLNRLSKVKWGGLCTPEMGVKSRLSTTLSPRSTFNDPNTGKVYFCNADGRDNSSEFYMIQYLAHEISHSISPCAYHEQSEYFFPVRSLISCLKLNEGANVRKVAGACSDAMDEAAADYMATEALVHVMSKKKLSREQYQKGFANAFRYGNDDCVNSRVSVNKILLANPKVRKLMGCKSDCQATYCGSYRNP